MSNIKIGDKVKFLNAPGGGIVSKIIDTRTVNVMIEDGFEIPTMVGELVIVSSTERAARFFEDTVSVKAPMAAAEPELLQDDRITAINQVVISSRKREEIFLAFVPHDQKWLITGNMDILLINNTGFDLLYSVSHRTGLNHYQGLDYGNVFPDSEILLATINREQLLQWTDGVIQFLFHKDFSENPVVPFHAEFTIDGKKFYKEGNYKTHSMITGKGIVVKLHAISQNIHEDGSVKDIDSEANIQNELSKNELPFISRYQIKPGEAEIDLHIHELMEDPGNLENYEILEFQKSFLIRCLDSAMAANYRKLTVIHGVGNGVLKNVVLDILKKNEGIRFFDAPMHKYGAGAVDVFLRPPFSD
jgi:hypothetical protein